MSQTMRHVLGRSHGDFDGRRAVGGSPGNAYLALMSMARAGSLPEPPPRPQQSSPTGRVRGSAAPLGRDVWPGNRSLGARNAIAVGGRRGRLWRQPLRRVAQGPPASAEGILPRATRT